MLIHVLRTSLKGSEYPKQHNIELICCTTHTWMTHRPVFSPFVHWWMQELPRDRPQLCRSFCSLLFSEFNSQFYSLLHEQIDFVFQTQNLFFDSTPVGFDDERKLKTINVSKRVSDDDEKKEKRREAQYKAAERWGEWERKKIISHTKSSSLRSCGDRSRSQVKLYVVANYRA